MKQIIICGLAVTILCSSLLITACAPENESKDLLAGKSEAYFYKGSSEEIINSIVNDNGVYTVEIEYVSSKPSKQYIITDDLNSLGIHTMVDENGDVITKDNVKEKILNNKIQWSNSFSYIRTTNDFGQSAVDQLIKEGNDAVGGGGDSADGGGGAP